MGKFLTILLVVCTIAAGVSIYYLQVYAYYQEVQPNGTDDVQITARDGGRPESIPYDAFRAIDSQSSPIRYRACFTTTADPAELPKTFVLYDNPEPLVAPRWFDCFEAGAIGDALESGAALAYLGTGDIHYGIDRIVAITDDGRGYVWHQINRCGEIVFDGNPAPDDCPKPPEGY